MTDLERRQLEEELEHDRNLLWYYEHDLAELYEDISRLTENIRELEKRLGITDSGNA